MPQQKQVMAFFSKPSGGQPPTGNPFELNPVVRFANPSAPGRGSIEALLGGPTPVEEGEGFLRLDSANLSIGTITIENGVATVDFFSGNTKSWNGDLSPGTFRLAVEATLDQFDSVQTVTVKVDGDPDFGSLEG